MLLDFNGGGTMPGPFKRGEFEAWLDCGFFEANLDHTRRCPCDRLAMNDSFKAPHHISTGGTAMLLHNA